MFIGAASLIVIYIYMGIWTMSACLGARTFSNPLWYGLVFIFWPIAVLVGLVGLFIEWIKDIREYYKKKGEKKE